MIGIQPPNSDDEDWERKVIRSWHLYLIRRFKIFNFSEYFCDQIILEGIPILGYNNCQA